jgi:hypothetical protein
MTRSRFVVGRRFARTVVMVVTQVAEPAQAPIAGPWTLAAVVTPT